MGWMEKVNEDFERRLKPEIPLDLLLAETEPAPTIEQLEKQAAELAVKNCWPAEAAFNIEGAPTEENPLTFRDLTRQDTLRDKIQQMVEQELRRSSSHHVPEENDEEEPREAPQLPEDRGGTRFDRHVARMKARIEAGATVEELRKIASSDYSRQVIEAAAA